jgi:hypothetical protein
MARPSIGPLPCDVSKPIFADRGAGAKAWAGPSSEAGRPTRALEGFAVVVATAGALWSGPYTTACRRLLLRLPAKSRCSSYYLITGGRGLVKRSCTGRSRGRVALTLDVDQPIVRPSVGPLHCEFDRPMARPSVGPLPATSTSLSPIVGRVRPTALLHHGDGRGRRLGDGGGDAVLDRVEVFRA